MKKLAAVAVLGLWSGMARAQTCPIQVPETVPLLANSTIPAGTVTVSNNILNIFVTISTVPDWTIARADVAIGTTLAGIPQTNGQPDIKSFPYSQTFCPEVTSITFTIPLGTIKQNDTIFVAAHVALDSPTQGHQQAWGAGTLFPGSAACRSGAGCRGGHEGDDSRAGMRPKHSGDECDDSTFRPGSLAKDDGGGDDEGDSCSGEGDFHSEHDDAIVVINHGGDADHGGGQQCGGSAGSHHGDSSDASVRWGSSSDHKDKGDCRSSQCGATYFTYMVNCIVPE